MKTIVELLEKWTLADLTSVDQLSPEDLHRLESDSEKKWYPLTLPAQVHDVLLKEGVIEDPAGLGKTQACLWVAERDWIYRKTFRKEKDGKKIYLHFKGLDTLVDIWLNGKLVGTHNDMYLPNRIDVTEVLQAENDLVLHFHSPHEYIKKHPLPEKWDGLIYPFRVIRKCDNDFNDYLGAKPYFTRIGVYDKVLLEYVQEAEFSETDIRVQVSRDLKAGTVGLRLKGSRSGESVSVSVTAVLADPSGKEILTQNCPVLANRFDWASDSVLTVDAPLLWWPRGYGDHPLYTLTLTVCANGTVEEINTRQIGFRRIEMVNQFDFYINNVQTKLWGAQPAQVNGMTHCWNNAKSNLILDLAENCNMNAQRIWGGSDRYDDAYYEECDRRGILVWQEFFHNYTMYPNNPEFRALCKAEVTFQVMRLKHHPCILFWCGGNESFMGAEFTLPGIPYIGGEIFLQDYEDVCSTFDPDRYFHPNSPWGGPYTNDPLEGDTHSYTNTFYVPGADYPIMVAEEIRTSPPPVRSMKRYLGDQAWPADYNGLMTKDTAYPWPETWNQRTSTQGWLKIPPIEEYYDADSLESVVYRFGAAHGRYLRKILENNRRGKPAETPDAERICMGHFVCRWNDSWPIIYGSMLDYYLEPYIPYYETKRSFEPVLISFDIRNFITAWVTNDTTEKVSGTLTVRLFDPFKNEFVSELRRPVEVNPGESRLITNLNEFHQFSRQYVIYGILEDENGNLITRTNDFADIERHMRFPDARLNLSVEGDVLTITCDRFAHCVELNGHESGDEFGWIFEDNYFDLLPGETKRIRILGKHRKGEITAKAYYASQASSLNWNLG